MASSDNITGGTENGIYNRKGSYIRKHLREDIDLCVGKLQSVHPEKCMHQDKQHYDVISTLTE